MRTRRQRSSSDPVTHSGHRPQLDRQYLTGHKPVLLHESLEYLALQPDDVVLDATLGGAGHGKEIVKHLDSRGTFIGIDADKGAIERAEIALKDFSAQVILIHGNFRDIESHLGKHEIQHISKALFDLGWSAFQLEAGRGFSFRNDEPLLMTYSDSLSDNALTAGTIVNTWGEESIADIIYGWGEERFSRHIARGIVEARKKKPIATSRELGEIIKSSYPVAYRNGRIHPATKTFQALRIAVNDEMGALKQGLQSVWNVLQPGGRLAVISFHSVEDREVKRFMLEQAQAGKAERITKSPIRPSREELLENPRARSAKLRVIRKL